MGDRDEIEAVLDWIAQVSFGYLLVGSWRDFDMKDRLVDRRLDLVRNRGHRTQVGGNGVEIASGEDLVETIGHDRRERDPGRPNSLDECLFDVICSPLADTAVWVGRDVRAFDSESRLVKRLRSARIKLRAIENAARSARRMAVAARQNAFH